MRKHAGNTLKRLIPVAVMLLAVIPSIAPAADPGTSPNDSKAENPPAEEGPGLSPQENPPGLLERYHKAVSLELDTVVRRLDTFFVEERTDERYQGYRLRVRIGEGFSSRAAPDFKSNFRLDASFPNTRRRLGLLIQTESVTGDEEDPQALVDNPDEKTNLSAALRLFLLKTENLSTDFDAGVRFRPRPDPYTKARADYELHLTRYFLVRPAQFLFWYYEDGVGERSRLDFDLAVRKNALFRVRADGLWKKSDEGYRYLGKVLYREKLARGHGYQVAGTMIGHTQLEPVISLYRFDILWRQMVIRDWLFFEVNPFMEFHEVDDYEGAPGITLFLEINFEHD